MNFSVLDISQRWKTCIRNYASRKPLDPAILSLVTLVILSLPISNSPESNQTLRRIAFVGGIYLIFTAITIIVMLGNQDRKSSGIPTTLLLSSHEALTAAIFSVSMTSSGYGILRHFPELTVLKDTLLVLSCIAYIAPIPFLIQWLESRLNPGESGKKITKFYTVLAIALPAIAGICTALVIATVSTHVQADELFFAILASVIGIVFATASVYPIARTVVLSLSFRNTDFLKLEN